MACDFSTRIDQHFASLTDPRRGKLTYPLINIVTIALCATIAGADDFVAIADWARQKRDWLGQFLDLSSGIPSHDRFNAIFGMLKPGPLERCLVSWITELHQVSAGQLLAIDGKTMRQSFDKATAKSALHMVSVWATASKISLGQVALAQKSNEITAIPQLLNLVEIAGALVTIDAMGCQVEIVEKQADYMCWPSKATSRRYMTGSWSSSSTRWMMTSPESPSVATRPKGMVGKNTGPTTSAMCRKTYPMRAVGRGSSRSAWRSATRCGAASRATTSGTTS